MTIDEIQNEIIQEFGQFNNDLEKYNYLMKLGRNLKPIDPQYKTDDYLIRGCQVNTWYHSACRDKKMFYDIDSASLITKGFIFLLLRICDGQSSADLKNTEFYFIDKIGFQGEFSPLKDNSLFKLINKIKTDASVLASS
ncbi:MAG TPA: SufE family protein [Candidatus Pacearchaeota archaeon]|nr:SufE family protein [Candidatus Pacearchaeota archaeon]HRR94721.1 SufE family protein [Candidatus Paceibacterota bacterium]HPC30499.1 SufE family protein [Candidatus Pacearchaeota archaeon]HQG09237.1 SufE family protein [Candidatus Pacearchaeota archaeon]HQH20171.1 SufE family protein [Candidatus Pacearchaeota archaeon]